MKRAAKHGNAPSDPNDKRYKGVHDEANRSETMGEEESKDGR